MLIPLIPLIDAFIVVDALIVAGGMSITKEACHQFGDLESEFAEATS